MKPINEIPRKPSRDSALASQSPLPLPFKNRSFLYFLTTQALGAFNDNVFKQLVLLLGIGYMMSGINYQATVQFLFAVPFLIFSGLAGDLSDRFSKGRLMTACKVAEIVIALAGVGAFLLATDSATGNAGAPPYLWLLALVVFVLGSQSAFFGPPKYGGLPELVREGDLAPATGLTQMTTFLAIIFGVSLAGLLADIFADRLYLAGLVTVTIAGLGTLTSLGIARCPATAPRRQISLRSFGSVLPTLSSIIHSDPLMFRIMIVYSWFWFVGGVTLTAINALGRLQLGLNNFQTSLMVATTSIGIAAGSVIVGRMSRGKVRLGLIVPGMALMVFCQLGLFLLPLHTPTPDELELLNHLKNTPVEMQDKTPIVPVASEEIRTLCFGFLFLMGAASGFFSVPLLTFIQARPPSSEKGRVFAAVNWLNWVFIVASAIAYGTGMGLVDNHANRLMGALGILTLLVGLFLLPGIFRTVRKEQPAFVYSRHKT